MRHLRVSVGTGRMEGVTFPIRTARRVDAVPPGRLGYDLSAPVLLLHTIQTAEALDELLDTGRLVPDPSRAMDGYEDGYGWMLRQMNARLPTRGEGMLWLWAKIGRRDLVSNCLRSPGRVLLTCRIPRERALLSHFDEWHYAMNVFPNIRPLPGEDEEAFGARHDAAVDDFWDRLEASGAARRPARDWPDPLRREIEGTWEAIFDLAAYPRTDWWQATIHELLAEDVVEAVRLDGVSR